VPSMVQVPEIGLGRRRLGRIADRRRTRSKLSGKPIRIVMRFPPRGATEIARRAGDVGNQAKLAAMGFVIEAMTPAEFSEMLVRNLATTR
jgi:hypothetical protein